MTNAKCADQMKTFEKRRKNVVNIYRNGDFKKVYLKKSEADLEKRCQTQE